MGDGEHASSDEEEENKYDLSLGANSPKKSGASPTDKNGRELFREKETINFGEPDGMFRMM